MAQAHKLDDDLLITNHLETRLADEGAFESGDENKGYWSARQRSNGQVITRAKGYEAGMAEASMATFLLQKLNKEIALDGMWVVSITDDGDRFIMVWFDGDGDAQFTVEVDMDEIPLEDWTHWVQSCMEAWECWHENMRQVLAPKADQLFKKAQGQTPESIRNPGEFRRT